MLNLVFSALAVVIFLLIIWGLVILFLSLCGVAAQLIGATPMFWGAVVGGLVAFVIGYQSEQSLITGMIYGGIVGLIILCYSWLKDFWLFRVIICTLIGVGIGQLFGMMIIGGIIGLGVGIYRG